MNIATQFADSAATNAEKIAVFFGEDNFSYKHFKRESTALAAHLLQKNALQPGARVAIWLKNCPEFISAFYGILQASGVGVPINNFLKPPEVSYILKDAGANIIITDNELAEKLAEILPDHPDLRIIKTSEFADLKAASGEQPPSSSRHESDLAVIIYTSGTTGSPKGAMLSHGNLLHNVASCQHELEAVELDRMAILLPMFHSFMLTVGVLLPTLVGGSLVLIRSLHPPKNIVMEIIKHQATILPAIPQLFRTLANTKLPPLPLRLCISGAAPLPVEVLNQFTDRVGIPLIEGYGLSEASPVVSLNPIRGTRKPGSIGRPIKDVEVSIQDEQGNSLPAGEIGEVCVRGGNVMSGYWNRPDESARTLVNDWLRTGDIGYQDEEGYFFITDRKKDMLLVNGVNVYPREIEETIYQIPGIKEAAVVGKAHPQKGEQPVAFVVTDEGAELTTDQIREFLKERLAAFKSPREIQICDALPRNATGKILKTKLRQRLEQA
ncbi:MAG: Long-chain-fatty-acid--CoA ligase [Verrucomicrobia subdivision 3 bacterium]|nr:Long-chain-fatty-acid--CoA ligase [Limisphaerales bacterium]MCS1415306.1 Long-chain-fatty-acid--CoA ligase [Limisphaerales bacterium]